MRDMSVFNEAGFLISPDEWSDVMMFEIANREGIKMSAEMVDLVLSCRKYYDEYQTVPALREFSKLHNQHVTTKKVSSQIWMPK